MHNQIHFLTVDIVRWSQHYQIAIHAIYHASTREQSDFELLQACCMDGWRDFLLYGKRLLGMPGFDQLDLRHVRCFESSMNHELWQYVPPTQGHVPVYRQRWDERPTAL
jgi:hypothetical protein